MRIKIVTTGLALFAITTSFAQDVVRTLPNGYDPHREKLIPDKVFEIGLPLLVIFLIANSIVNIFKVRAENRLKEKALDRQLSEETLVALFSQDKSLAKYGYLKWFLILAALGLSLVYLHLLAQYAGIRSAYLGLGVMALFLSVAFFIYYRVIRNK